MNAIEAGLTAPVLPAPPSRPFNAPAPVTGWRRLLADSLLVGGSTAICHALGAATSLLLRLFLDPAQMGIWQGLKVFLGYANYANLGVSKAAARDLSIALGRGDAAPAGQSLNLAYTVNTLSSLLYGAVLIVAGLHLVWCHGASWSDPWACGLIAIGGLSVLQRYATFQVTVLRARQAFRAATRLSVLEAVLTLTASAAATWLWGIRGLFMATLVVFLGSLWYLRRQPGTAFRWAWDTRQVVRLVAIGGPILAAGVVQSLFTSLDKLMILAYLDDGDYQLGCYSVALLVTTQLYGLGNMLSIATGPRYAELLGRTGNRCAVAELAARVSELQAAVLVLVGSLAIVLAPPILARILPDYRTGLAALAWLVPGTLAMIAALPVSQYLMAVEGGRRVLLALIVATAVAVAGNHLALTHGRGLAAVAAATTLANLVYLVLLVSTSLWPALRPDARLRYLAGVSLCLVPTLALAIGLKYWLPTDLTWTATAAEVCAIAGLWGLIIAAGWRYAGWSAVCRSSWTNLAAAGGAFDG